MFFFSVFIVLPLCAPFFPISLFPRCPDCCPFSFLFYFLFFYYASALKDKRWAQSGVPTPPSLANRGNSCRAFCLPAKIRTHLRSRYCPLIRTRQDGEQRRLNCLTRNLFQHRHNRTSPHPPRPTPPSRPQPLSCGALNEPSSRWKGGMGHNLCNSL